MQSGQTGINAIRMYNPIKQSQDQDPNGVFIKRWLPELRDVPVSFVHEPWQMPRVMQKTVGCIIGQDYPAPIIDYDQRTKQARATLAALRKTPDFKAIAAGIHDQHGSRLKRRKGAKRGVKKQQLGFEF